MSKPLPKYEPAHQLMFETRHAHCAEAKQVGLLNTKWPATAWVTHRFLNETEDRFVTVDPEHVHFHLANATATYRIEVVGNNKVTLSLVDGEREDWPFVKEV